MWVRLATCACGALILLSSFRAAPVQAQATDVATQYRAEVVALFEKSWDMPAGGLASAEQHHRRATALLPGDPRADLALAMVQWRYLKYEQAEQTLARLTASSPDYWPATQAKIYLNVLSKKHAAVLPELNRLSEQVAAASTVSSASQSESERRDAIEFMARIFAYYEGPAVKQVSQTSVAEVRGQVVARLTESERETFSAAFGAVAERYAQLDETARRTQAEALDAEKQGKEQALQQLGAEKAALDAEKQALQKQAQDALERTQAEVGKLDQQIGPLEARLGQLLAQAQVVNNQIARLDGDISIALAGADATDDPAQKGAFLARADFLTAQIRRAEFDLRALEAQAVPLQAQRNALLQQRAQVVARYEADARRLGVEAAKLGRNEQRIGVQQKLAQKPPTGISPNATGKATIAASITSYIDPPPERETVRILNSF